MYFQNKYVKSQYIKSNNKVLNYSSFKEIKYIMSPEIPLITT